MPGWGATLQLAAGLGILAIAVALFALSPGRRGVRVFALLLCLQGMMQATAALSLFPDDAAAGALWAEFHAYFVVAIPFATLYFVAIFPQTRRWLPRGWPGVAMFALPAVALLVWNALDDAIFWDVSGYSSATEAYSDPSVTKGPLVLAIRVAELSAAAAALVLARDHAGAVARARRTSILLVSLGFFVPAACTCAVLDLMFRLRHGLFLSGEPAAGFSAGVGLVYDALLGLQVLALGALMAFVALRTRQAKQPDRRLFLTSAALLGATVGSAALAMTLVHGTEAQLEATYAAWGFWALVGACLVAYGVLRRHVFDVDLKLKWTMRRGTVGAAFLAVFFVVAQIVQNATSEVLGWLGGAVAAGLLLFAFRPIERAANRVADAAMPGVRDDPDYIRVKKTEVYTAALEGAMQDGRVTDKERSVLTRLQLELGISNAEARGIEATVATGSPRRPVAVAGSS